MCFYKYFDFDRFLVAVLFSGRSALKTRDRRLTKLSLLRFVFNSIHFCSTKFDSSIISKLICSPFSCVIKLISNHFAFNKNDHRSFAVLIDFCRRFHLDLLSLKVLPLAASNYDFFDVKADGTKL